MNFFIYFQINYMFTCFLMQDPKLEDNMQYPSMLWLLAILWVSQFDMTFLTSHIYSPCGNPIHKLTKVLPFVLFILCQWQGALYLCVLGYFKRFVHVDQALLPVCTSGDNKRSYTLVKLNICLQSSTLFHSSCCKTYENRTGHWISTELSRDIRGSYV